MSYILSYMDTPRGLHYAKNQGQGGREGGGNAERPERATEVARGGCPGTG